MLLALVFLVSGEYEGASVGFSPRFFVLDFALQKR